MALGIGLQLTGFAYERLDRFIRRARIAVCNLCLYCSGNLKDFRFARKMERFKLLQNVVE